MKNQDLQVFNTKYKIEDTHTLYDYGCLMLDLDFKHKKSVHSQVRLDDLYLGDGIEDDSSKFGLELEPHVTLLFGFHEEVGIQEILPYISKINIDKVKITDISHFSNEKYDVLKYDIDANGLLELHEMLKELPHNPSPWGFNPHMTISYVEKGKGGMYTKMTPFPENNEIKVGNISFSTPAGHKYKFPKIKYD